MEKQIGRPKKYTDKRAAQNLIDWIAVLDDKINMLNSRITSLTSQKNAVKVELDKMLIKSKVKA